MLLTIEHFQTICPDGIETIEDLADVVRSTLDGDPDGVVDDILDEDNEGEIKAQLLQKFETNPDYHIIGGVVYHDDEVKSFVNHWLHYMFRGVLMVDPPDNILAIEERMVDQLIWIETYDGITPELTAKAFKETLENLEE